jgi:hypothetical protein
VHDFIDRDLGKAIPYGVYDVFRNEGWVSVGIDHDTAEFAVASIRRWWQQMGSKAYPDAKEVLITADAGGSNGPRVRLWKVELQKLADETGLRIQVSHYPPGTSKWNKIEHRMFCHITQNWRGRPLKSLETVVNLIGSTSTAAGLRIKAAADKRRYPKGREISDAVVAAVRLVGAKSRPEWNYAITPASDQTYFRQSPKERAAIIASYRAHVCSRHYTPAGCSSSGRGTGPSSVTTRGGRTPAAAKVAAAEPCRSVRSR